MQNVQAHSKILGENNGLRKSFSYVLPFAALTENKGAGKKIFPSWCLYFYLCPSIWKVSCAHKVPQTMPDLVSAICPLQVHSPDNTALVSLVPLHIEVTVVCNGKDMRWKLSNPLVIVQSDLIRRVEGQQLVWIHCYKDWSCVSLENSCEHYCYSKPATKATCSINLNRGRREAWDIIAALGWDWEPSSSLSAAVKHPRIRRVLPKEEC